MSSEKINIKADSGNEGGLEKFLTIDKFLADKDFVGASLMGSKWAEYAGRGSEVRLHNPEERRDLIARIMTRLRKTDTSIETQRSTNSTSNTYKSQDWEKGYAEYKKRYSRYQRDYL